MGTKKVMIYAYTAHNLGDDLFIHLLCTRYPDVHFYLYAPKKYKQTFHELTNLQVLPNHTTIKKIRQRLRSLPKTAVYIGGSLFIEQNGWEKQWKQLKRARKRHRDFFILGANFGPYESEAFYHSYEALFKTCHDVCFRDLASYQLFEHIKQVRTANDLVFTHPVESVNITTPTIVISVIYPSIRTSLAGYDEAYFTTIAQLTEASVNAGYEVVLMAFCKREKDDHAIKAITEKIAPQHHSAISTFYYDTNIDAALDVIAKAEIIVATRFHAMILGILYHKKVFAVMYSKKMLTVMEDNEFAIAYRDIQDVQNVSAETILHEASHVHTSLEKLHDEAEKQFHVLDQYIRGYSS